MNAIVKKTESKVIKPYLDWSFKFLFGTEESKPNLIGFLNVMLNPEVVIEDVQFMNNESIPASQHQKGCVFDVICKDVNGDNFLIEVQTTQSVNIVDRLIYYTCRLMDRMGKRGSKWDYSNIKRVYSICLMTFTFEQDPKLRRDILLCDNVEHKIISDKFNIILLQLPCLKAESMEECTTNYEYLLYLLKEMQNGMKTVEQLKNEVADTYLPESTKELFNNILNRANEAGLTDEDKTIYDSDLKNYMDTMSCIEYAVIKGLKDGEKKGIEIGIEKGMEKGMEKGIEKVAKSLKAKGIDIATITDCTGLSPEQIEAL